MQEETSFRLVRNLNGDIWHSDSRRSLLAGMTIIIGIQKAKLLQNFRLKTLHRNTIIPLYGFYNPR